ncbi:ABC transporter permease [Mesoplasma photuris]|uniref:ABC transporter permease n=1 Tax=Mesoplasma photuris TaxID=217731 RepID=UPI0004E119C7|nr:ABC transporter permease [Mesoplasma photuris]
MKQIIKSYLKTFFKNWVSAIGTLLFLVMLVTVVIGMVSTPLQLKTKLTSFKNKTTPYDTQIKVEASTEYDQEFTYNFFYKADIEKYEEFFGSDIEISNFDDKTFLSESTLMIIDQDMEKNFGSINWREVADNQDDLMHYSVITKLNEIINNGLINFRTGALSKTNAYFVYSNNDQKSQEFKAGYIEEMTNIIIKDITDALWSSNYDQNLINLKNNEDLISAVVRSITKMDEAFKQNGGSGIDITSLISSGTIPNIKDILIFLNDSLNENINEIFKEGNKIYLLGFQFINLDFYNILKQQGNDYNDQTFLIRKVIKNSNKFYNQYLLDVEQTYLLSKIEAGSISPSKSIQLATYDNDQKFNELFYSEGSSVIDQNSQPNSLSRKELPGVVISSGYAKANNINVGDVFTTPSSPVTSLLFNIDKKDAYYANEISFEVTGIGNKLDDLVPSDGFSGLTQKIDTFGFAYASKEMLREIHATNWNFSKTPSNSYSMNYKVKNNIATNNIANIFKSENNDFIFDQKEEVFIDWSDSSIANKISNINLQVFIFISLGVAVLVLAFIFINFTIKKEMNETRKQLGIFKSFGYKVKELSWIFALKTYLQILLGLILGWLVSIPFQIYASNSFGAVVTFEYSQVYTGPVFLSILFIIIPVIFLLLSFGLTILYLREPTLSLINNQNKLGKKKKQNFFNAILAKHQFAFGYRLRGAFVKAAKGKFIIVQFLFAFSALVYTMMFGAQALLTQTIDQGLRMINDDTDHRYIWEYDSNINITKGQEKFNIYGVNEEEFVDGLLKSYDYKNSDSINKAIDTNEESSDSRYRIKALMQAIRNTLVQEEGIEKVLLPKEGIEFFLSTLSNSSAKSPVFVRDYYLNTMNAYKMLDSDLLKDQEELIKANQSIDITLDDLNQNSEDWIQDLSANNIGDDLEKTFFGMKPYDRAEEKFNNMFITDSSRLIAIKMAETYGQAIFIKELTNNFTELDKIQNYTQEEFDIAYNKLLEDQLLNDFDPNNSIYWSMSTNPIMQYLSNSLQSKEFADQINSKATSRASTGGLNLNLVSATGQTIIMGSMMLDEIKSIDEEPVVTFNQLFYDSTMEHLDYNMDALFDDSKVKNVGAAIVLSDYDSNNNILGDPRNQLNFDGVSNQIIEDLSYDYEGENKFNAVIDYYFAKKNNIKVGDHIQMTTDTIQKIPFTVVVTGINEAVKIQLTQKPQVQLDYRLFFDKMFDDALKEIMSADDYKRLLINEVWSRKEMLSGNIDINDLQGSVSKMKFTGDTIAIKVNNDSAILTSLFDGLFKELDSIKSKFNQIDDASGMYTNPNPISGDIHTTGIPINISKTAVKILVDSMQQLMMILILLQTLLLSIILIVVMNIIVEESTRTILTMKSLGYKRRQINWVVMGSYVIGAIISFIVAYILSIVVWAVFVQIAAAQWSLYMSIPFSWQAIVITFLVLGFVITLGWWASDKQVQNKPLSRITNF